MRPFLSWSSKPKRCNTYYLVYFGAIIVINFLNQSKSMYPLWFKSILSNRMLGFYFLSFKIATISSIFRDKTSPCFLKSTCNTFYSMTFQSIHPVLLLSRQLNIVEIQWDVIVGSISLIIATKVPSFSFSDLYFFIMFIMLTDFL